MKTRNVTQPGQGLTVKWGDIVPGDCWVFDLAEANEDYHPAVVTLVVSVKERHGGADDANDLWVTLFYVGLKGRCWTGTSSASSSLPVANPANNFRLLRGK